MSLSSIPIATVPLFGKQVPVYTKGVGNSFEYRYNQVWVGSSVGGDMDKLNSAFEKYCQVELKKIVTNQIQKLRSKKVKVKLDYIRAGKKVQVDEVLSVNDYLDKFGYSREIEIEIKPAEKEWGINSIDGKRKQFKLFFNQNLIKYDSGKHIEYVVAHELTHVFHRHHEKEFHNTLARLYLRKKTSENFFSNRIRFVFAKSQVSNSLFIFLIGVFVVIVLFLLFGYLSQIFSLLLTPQTRF